MAFIFSHGEFSKAIGVSFSVMRSAGLIIPVELFQVVQRSLVILHCDWYTFCTERGGGLFRLIYSFTQRPHLFLLPSCLLLHIPKQFLWWLPAPQSSPWWRLKKRQWVIILTVSFIISLSVRRILGLNHLRPQRSDIKRVPVKREQIFHRIFVRCLHLKLIE